MTRSTIATALFLLLACVTPVSGQGIAPTAAPIAAAASKSRLADVQSWGYQLQRVDIGRVAHSPYDLVVVDYSNLGTEAGRFTPQDVAQLQRKADGSRRIVLAYLSIGEAEDYRYYWRDNWVEAIQVLDDPSALFPGGRKPAQVDSQAPVRLKSLRLPKLGGPAWLGRENEGWTGNFLIRYWDPGWQNIIFRGPDSYLSRILNAGFDGVYLDRVDAFQAVGKERPQARSEMVRLVIAIAAAARSQRADFIIVPQNGEQLLADTAYLSTIDAIAKEDLLYGDEQDGQRNPLTSVSRSMRWLSPAMNRGLPVLVVEYVQSKPLVDQLRADISSRGFIPYFGVRALDRLVLAEDLIIPPVAPPVAATRPARASGKSSSSQGGATSGQQTDRPKGRQRREARSTEKR